MKYCRHIPFVMAAILIIGCSTGDDAGDQGPRSLTVNPIIAPLLSAGDQALQRGDLVSALALADSAESMVAGESATALLRGNALLGMQRFEEAGSAYLTGFERNPDLPGLPMRLGFVAEQLGDPVAAISWYRRESHPDARTLVSLGELYADVGKADSSGVAFDAAIRIEPNNVRSILGLARLRESLGFQDEALELAQRALTLDPENAAATFVTGNLLSKLDRIPEALPLLRTAAKDPLNYAAKHGLARALQVSGDSAAASAMFLEASEARSRVSDIARLQRTASSQPGAAEPHVMLGDLYRQVGIDDRALASYQQAAGANPTDGGPVVKIAEVLLSSGNIQEAVAAYQEALDRNPTIAKAWSGLGLTSAMIGDCDRALDAWSRAEALDPSFSTSQIDSNCKKIVRQ